eukprot:gb/GFBE01081756.1/.p1 GENE.gb/GFBE01081756.1/~~gb/GFBE01081756.1/.p1  ORF type:complete len:431 (+),score=93.48 gb/GFBE01081756.1/:1-1293(+)
MLATRAPMTTSTASSGLLASAAEKLDKFAADGQVDFEAWTFPTRSYVQFLGLFTVEQLRLVESLATPIPPSAVSAEQQCKSRDLYFLLTQLLRGRASKILHRVNEGEGLEAWRVLARKVHPEGAVSQTASLLKILRFDFGSSLEEFTERLLDFDLLVDAYNRQHELEDVPSDVQKTVVIGGAPEPLQTQLQLLPGGISYPELRSKIDDYIAARQKWKEAQPAATPKERRAASSAAMEIDALTSWKGKGKGKGKTKGKAGKGKQGKSGKGGLLRGNSLMPVGACPRCGEYGHRLRDCEEEEDEDPGDLTNIQCWNCWGRGHRARNCSSRMQDLGLQMVAEEVSTACVVCGRHGHVAARCPTRGSTINVLVESDGDQQDFFAQLEARGAAMTELQDDRASGAAMTEVEEERALRAAMTVPVDSSEGGDEDGS